MALDDSAVMHNAGSWRHSNAPATYADAAERDHRDPLRVRRDLADQFAIGSKPR